MHRDRVNRHRARGLEGALKTRPSCTKRAAYLAGRAVINLGVGVSGAIHFGGSLRLVSGLHAYCKAEDYKYDLAIKIISSLVGTIFIRKTIQKVTGLPPRSTAEKLILVAGAYIGSKALSENIEEVPLLLYNGFVVAAIGTISLCILNRVLNTPK